MIEVMLLFAIIGLVLWIAIRQGRIARKQQGNIMGIREDFDALKIELRDVTSLLAARFEAAWAKKDAGNMTGEEEAALAAEFRVLIDNLKMTGVTPDAPFPPLPPPAI